MWVESGDWALVYIGHMTLIIDVSDECGKLIKLKSLVCFFYNESLDSI